MTILQAIQNSNPPACTFAFANIQEFQSFTQKYSFEDFPVNVVFPFNLQGTTNQNTGIRSAVVTIEGFIFTRVSEETNNYRSLTMEDVINPMREYAFEFIKNLVESEIVNRTVQSITDNVSPVYAELPDHFFGVRYSVQLPIYSNVCVDENYIITEDSNQILSEEGDNLITE